MKKNRIFKYIGSSLLALGLLALIIFLNLSVQKNTTISNENNAKANQQTKLNVAIVNEDKPVYVDTKEYNLGASYVKISSVIIHKIGLLSLVEQLILD